MKPNINFVHMSPEDKQKSLLETRAGRPSDEPMWVFGFGLISPINGSCALTDSLKIKLLSNTKTKNLIIVVGDTCRLDVTDLKSQK